MIAIRKPDIVPEDFRPHQIKNYPSDNHEPFEEWFYKYHRYTVQKETERTYLPIFWTSYYGNHKHGRDRRAMNKLQFFLDHHLDRGKKYYTIVQNDDSILNNVSHLDLLTFGMGCKGHIQLPLVCQPHKYEFKETGRPIFASFIGSITHPIREQMVKELQGKEGYFISTEPTSLHSYCYIMSQSKYVLCPRGYGLSSFRCMESLQYGAVPIYISSDEFLFSLGCINTNHVSSEEKLLDIMWSESSITHCHDMFNQHYTYEAVANRIYENL